MHTQVLDVPREFDAAAVPLESTDAIELKPAPRYCPPDLLAGFAWLMAGHGRCVNTAMMLGDREYAMWQLACAKALQDEELGAIARRLFPYFDDRGAGALG